MSDETKQSSLGALIQKNKGGRPKGYAKTGGRVKGSTNKIHAAILREMLMKKSMHEKAVKHLDELLEDEDPKIRLSAVKTVLDRCFGKVHDEQANLDRQARMKELEAAARAGGATRFQITIVQQEREPPIEAKVIDVQSTDKGD